MATHGHGQQRERRRAGFAASGAAVPWCMPSAPAGNAAGVHLAPPFAAASLSFRLPWGGAAARAARPAPFASIGAAAKPPRLFATKQQEAATGISFPENLCVATARHCPGLAGVGVRAKRILGLKNINVYALGLYVDAGGAKRALSKFKGSSSEQLAKNQKAYDALVDAESFERSLRLVISFGALKRQQFVSALEERLAPPLKKAGKPGVMKQFEALFESVEFKKGTAIDFSATGRGKLVTKVNGSQVGVIESPELVKALFGIYLGPDPVSADAKASFGRGLAALLAE